MNAHATALIADDEPLLRHALRRQLGIVWPELEIVAEARNGREAVRLFDERHPDICFLDVHMPGLSGVDAATSSMSMPPAALAIITGLPAARSSTRLRYSSRVIRRPSSTSTRETTRPAGPV